MTTVKRVSGAKSYVLGVMSYLGVLCLVPLIVNKEDELVHFHAKQGLVLWVWSVLALLFLQIPGIGKIMFSTSVMAILICSIVGILSVLLGKAWKIPLVSNVSNVF